MFRAQRHAACGSQPHVAAHDDQARDNVGRGGRPPRAAAIVQPSRRCLWAPTARLGVAAVSPKRPHPLCCPPLSERACSSWPCPPRQRRRVCGRRSARGTPSAEQTTGCASIKDPQKSMLERPHSQCTRRLPLRDAQRAPRHCGVFVLLLTSASLYIRPRKPYVRRNPYTTGCGGVPSNCLTGCLRVAAHHRRRRGHGMRCAAATAVSSSPPHPRAPPPDCGHLRSRNGKGGRPPPRQDHRPHNGNVAPFLATPPTTIG